jgi:hypothetical protein
MPQRSPIIVGLLFAASLGSCAVALSWTAVRPQLNFANIAYIAMLGGYLSVVCLWSALQLRRNFWSRSAPVAAVILASIAFTFADVDFIALLALFGAHAALLLGALWIFRRSRYWRQRTGIETDWQFSVAQLLVVMTVVALLVVAFQANNLWQDGGDETAWFVGSIAGSTVLAIASAYIWSLGRHWLLRLAGILTVAIGLGVPFYFTRYGEHLLFFATCHFLIQALVIVAWIGWGGILPVKELSETNANQS